MFVFLWKLLQCSYSENPLREIPQYIRGGSRCLKRRVLLVSLAIANYNMQQYRSFIKATISDRFKVLFVLIYYWVSLYQIVSYASAKI